MSSGRRSPTRPPPPCPRAALPVITFADDDVRHERRRDRTTDVPQAHTDGDSLIHFVGANVLHMGDLFFNGNYPFIDVDSGGSIDGMIAGTERALELAGPATKIIPRHGPLADRAALTAFHDRLVTARERIAPLVAAGGSLEEVQAAKPTARFYERWGWRLHQARRVRRVRPSQSVPVSCRRSIAVPATCRSLSRRNEDRSGPRRRRLS